MFSVYTVDVRGLVGNCLAFSSFKENILYVILNPPAGYVCPETKVTLKLAYCT
jgi:hypothetical protein